MQCQEPEVIIVPDNEPEDIEPRAPHKITWDNDQEFPVLDDFVKRCSGPKFADHPIAYAYELKDDAVHHSIEGIITRADEMITNLTELAKNQSYPRLMLEKTGLVKRVDILRDHLRNLKQNCVRGISVKALG